MNMQPAAEMSANKAESEKNTKIYATFQRGEISSDQMLRSLMPMIKRMCMHVAVKYSNRGIENQASEISNDLVQDVSISLITRIKDLFNADKDSIASYLYASIKNKCLSEYTDNAVHFIGDPTTVLGHADSPEIRDDLTYEVEFDKITDRTNALEKAALAIQLRQKKALADPEKPLDPITMKPIKMTKVEPMLFDEDGKVVIKKASNVKPSEPTELAPDAQELKEIIEYLMLDYQEAANLLGCKKPTLSSYLYGKTVTVPHEVIDTARNLLQNPLLLEELKVFTTNDMQGILGLWADQLGIPLDDHERLAKALDINKITIQRWMAGNKCSMVNFKKHHRNIKLAVCNYD